MSALMLIVAVLKISSSIDVYMISAGRLVASQIDPVKPVVRKIHSLDRQPEKNT